MAKVEFYFSTADTRKIEPKTNKLEKDLDLHCGIKYYKIIQINFVEAASYMEEE
ncbi:uncharacterized protein SPAPADRAFT_60163 [Spathaspora passalidarum NRRL Y-27907]|uniref:Uncharacterized protein n=1 Tax=Spathaspora passalidarum (strain NRRL Y-27907 / 11-Y1) TaxID=619300 RepID=G3AMG7_SPAPN|nr:uncharacterized protein SPAPADRAFT_60163 [Spathaspora passalidarum NRRL Y-27907]EGW32819.1 hypothetical protein SPAPADRAFT_60163 [Spathaspora passalidarum NRRL Y-27907]